MAGLANLLLGYVWSCFQSRERLKAEIVVLRHQLNILQRKARKRPRRGARGMSAHCAEFREVL
jgi:hypothetical protein